MHEEDQNRLRAGLRATIRDRLYALADAHREDAALEHHVRRLREDSELAGFAVIAGLSHALEEQMRIHHPQDCLPVFLTYLTHSLALEPCGRESGAVLTLLLAGARRRLSEANLRCVA